jgi:hypothetical protein
VGWTEWRGESGEEEERVCLNEEERGGGDASYP